MQLIPKEYRTRIEPVGKWKIRITSYRLGDEYICVVDNMDPGATLERASASTRDEAESRAVQQAREKVLQTRSF